MAVSFVLAALVVAAAAAVAAVAAGAWLPQASCLELDLAGSPRLPASVWREAVWRAAGSVLRSCCAGAGAPRAVASAARVAVDERVARALGARDGDGLPALYWAVWTFPLVMWVLSHRSQRRSVLGAVHMSSLVRVREARLPRGGALGVTVAASGTEPHRRGTVLVITVDVGGGLWTAEHRMLLFHRGNAGAAPAATPAQAEAPADGVGEPVQIALERGAGRAWAELTGDYNPIHVSALGARALGFRRPIVHGMCLLHRALSALGRPDVRELSVEFRRPQPLGTTVTFRPPGSSAGGGAFAIVDGKGRACQRGSVSFFSPSST